MNLTKEETIYAARQFIDYYNQFETIVDYQKFVRYQRLGNSEDVGSLFPPEDDLFNDHSMSPLDMEFELNEVGKGNRFEPKDFHTYLDLIYSHANEKNIPGKRIQYVITEKNTQKIMGMIHLASPIPTMKPRNDNLGGVANLHDVNRHIIMGNIIVPTQPFGFNYNGGKLIAGICCSHEIRERVMEKYPKTQIVSFETTSLYGSTKGMSMYDGMKPLLRHYGDTVSNFPPNINDQTFTNLDHWFAERNGGEPLIPMITPTANNPKSPTSSRKKKSQDRFKSIIKKSLKQHNMLSLLKEYEQSLIHGTSLTERKRYYMSNYGYSNVGDVIMKGDDPIVNQQNWDKFYLENIIQWWKKKANNRWTSLKEDGRLRTELEVWTSGKDIDIIR